MQRNEYGEQPGVCGFAAAKSKYEDQGLLKHGRRRSLSEPLVPTRRHAESYAKLRKPPMIQSLYERPRNRLQKRITVPLTHKALPVFLFILEYEHYPYQSRPSEFLGVYSTLNSVTAAALRHGAYAFSREGLLDGSEYLSAEGRIKIVSYTVEWNGVKAATPDHPRPSQTNDLVRLDIPHPQSQNQGRYGLKESGARDTLYLAIHRSRYAATCIGLFTEKSLAWGACLRNKASCALAGTLVDESQEIVAKNMPSVSARLIGSGLQTWFVQLHEVDSMER